MRIGALNEINTPVRVFGACLRLLPRRGELLQAGWIEPQAEFPDGARRGEVVPRIIAFRCRAVHAAQRALEAQGGSVPIVALTANTLEDQLAEYAEAGMNDCIAKPVNAAELLQKVWAWTQAGLAEDGAESTAA